MFACVFLYNLSLEDYFIFSFFNKNKSERIKWAGTGYMYEYQKIMNKKNKIIYLEDKKIFLNKYKEFVKRKWFSIENINDLENALDYFNLHNIKYFVTKYSKGQTGSCVEIININDYSNAEEMFKYFKLKKYDLIEEFVNQCNYLNRISSSGLNTLRVITQLDINNKVNILGCRLRLTVNSPIDNLSAGNFALAIDTNNGKAISNGIFMDIQKEDIEFHPVSQFEISTIKLPNWKALLEFIYKVANLDTDLKTVGWDIAITEEGFELIEGNHNWGKTLYQLPINTGCKSILEAYKREQLV